jgi:hypothetical protein
METPEAMTGQDDDTAEALAALGYDDRWLAYGFVDDYFLKEQLARFRTGDDPYSEHYRYAAFLRQLKGRRDFDELSLTRYMELASLDHDRAMAASALIQLARLPGLTGEQRRRLRAHPTLANPSVQRALDRIDIELRGGQV